MAAQAARRWYQFSLKALLVLTLLCSIPPGIYVARRSYLQAQRRAEIEASFQWLESLDYPELPNDRPVRVTTRYWDKDESAAEAEASVSFGFLLSEDAESFVVLTRSLDRVTMPRKTTTEWYVSESSFESIDFPTLARLALDQTKLPDADAFAAMGPGLPERGELFVLAWACWRHGHRALGSKLYAAAEWEFTNEDADLPFLNRLANDFAYMETWRATEACGTAVPRRELLAKFQRLQKNFPDSEYADDVAKKVAMFEQMVAEDDLHTMQCESGPPFEQLSQQEQIAELIFQLRDQNGSQWSAPGWCDVFMTADDREDSPAHRLLKYGYDAIPQLADGLTDERLTRSVGYFRFHFFSHSVLTIGDAAEQIVERIAARRFDTAEKYEDEAARIADIRKNALAWHQELMEKGERVCLIEAVQRGDEVSESLAVRLLEKYPDEACTAILAAIRTLDKTDDVYPLLTFIELLGRIRSDESVPLLLAMLQDERLWVRLGAAQALTDQGRPEGIDTMLDEWNSSQQIAELDGMGSFLAGSGRIDAIEAVTRRFSEQSSDERLDTMVAAMPAEPEDLTAQPERRRAVIELLLVALKDTEVREGLWGSYGNKSYADPRVCDLAGYHLNCLDPVAFPFDLGAPLERREHERLAILQQHNEAVPAALVD